MNTRILALLAATGLSLAGCMVDNRSSIELAQICSFPAPDSDTHLCIYPATCDAGYAGNQFVDFSTNTAGAGAYLLVPIQIDNQLLDNADPSSNRPNTHDAQVEEFRITYQAPGLAIPSGVVRVGAHTVRSNSSSVLLAPVIPFDVGEFVKASIGTASLEVVANVKAAGHYMDGTQFVGGPITIPVAFFTGDGTVDIGCPADKEFFGACPQVGQPAAPGCQTPPTPPPPP